MSDLVTLPAEQFAPGIEGLFELEAEFYHDPYKAPGVSRSVLVEMLDLTAAHARSLMEGEGKKVTAAMKSGSLVDMALLEPHKFKEGVSHWVVPAGMNLTTVEGRAWKKDHPGVKEGGLPYLRAETDAADEASAVDMANIIESIMGYKEARFIIENFRKQESAFCLDPHTGLMRKVRPDARGMASDQRLVLADLKVTFRGGVTDDAWANQCAREMYEVQDSYYSDTYADLIGERPFFLFIAVERKPPYACRVFQLDPAAKEHARTRYRHALEHFKRCQESGKWPAYQGIKVISLPRWALRSPEPSFVDK